MSEREQPVDAIRADAGKRIVRRGVRRAAVGSRP